MGKKNSKLKEDTLDQLTTDTYCEYKDILNYRTCTFYHIISFWFIN